MTDDVSMGMEELAELVDVTGEAVEDLPDDVLAARYVELDEQYDELRGRRDELDPSGIMYLIIVTKQMNAAMEEMERRGWDDVLAENELERRAED